MVRKCFFVSAFVFCLLSSGFARAGEQEECKLPPAYIGSAEFEKMKSLAGAWEGESPMSPDGRMKMVYEVTSNGSAVVERCSPGTPYEMVSVYHDEKGKLAMTHYCAFGNQPKLTLASSSANKVKLVFAKGNAIKPKQETHMHSVEMTFAGPDHIRQEWVGYRNGKPQPPTIITLARMKETSR